MRPDRKDPKPSPEVEPSLRELDNEQELEHGPFGNHTDSAFDSGWFYPRDVDLESIT